MPHEFQYHESSGGPGLTGLLLFGVQVDVIKSGIEDAKKKLSTTSRNLQIEVNGACPLHICSRVGGTVSLKALSSTIVHLTTPAVESMLHQGQSADLQTGGSAAPFAKSTTGKFVLPCRRAEFPHGFL